tara:strand:+ start:1628 stop:1843 length:216 start_codon:yes stop_codon:yes gene_type:complete
MAKKTELIEIRRATSREREENNAETIFVRKDRLDNEYTIYSCKVQDSWEQWGVPKEILSDNVDDIEQKYSK